MGQKTLTEWIIFFLFILLHVSLEEKEKNWQ